MLFLRLFYEFFKTGLFSVGGGMATLPFLQDMAQNTGWFDSNQLADMIAVAESTPGPLGVNMSTYVGYTTGLQYGGVPSAILGAIIATIGLITPSIIVIIIISYFLMKFKNNKYVEGAFYGLRPASVALIAAAAVGIILLAFFGVSNITTIVAEFHFELKYLILAILIYIATHYVPKLKKLHPIVLILVSAVVGIIFKF